MIGSSSVTFNGRETPGSLYGSFEGLLIEALVIVDVCDVSLGNAGVVEPLIGTVPKIFRASFALEIEWLVRDPCSIYLEAATINIRAWQCGLKATYLSVIPSGQLESHRQNLASQ